MAALTGDTALLELLQIKWEKLAGGKMYVTGGTGHSSYHEGFAPDYDLPNEKAYCETCASLALIFWSHRLFLATGDARYIDVAERALYNGFLAGVSLSGDRFFYVNPLASRGNHHRQPWYGCTCCPTNVVRFLPTLGQYLYASTDDTVYINLYAAGSGKVKLGSRAVSLSQETSYPWDGTVKLSVNPTEPWEFTVAVRVPGWCREDATPGGLYRASGPLAKPMLTVNGAAFDAGAGIRFRAHPASVEAGGRCRTRIPHAHSASVRGSARESQRRPRRAPARPHRLLRGRNRPRRDGRRLGAAARGPVGC